MIATLFALYYAVVIAFAIGRGEQWWDTLAQLAVLSIVLYLALRNKHRAAR